MGGAIPMTLRLEIPKWEGVNPVRTAGGAPRDRRRPHPHHVVPRPRQRAVGPGSPRLQARQAQVLRRPRPRGQPRPPFLRRHTGDHWKAAQQADKVVVFGLQAKATGIWVPNELIAEYATPHPEKIIGWASVDPNEPECLDQLDHAVNTLKLRGPQARARRTSTSTRPTGSTGRSSRRSQRMGSRSSGTRARRSPSRAKLRWATAALARRHRAWTSRTCG